MNTLRPRFNVIEVALFAVALVVLSYTAGRSLTEQRLQPFLSSEAAELHELADRYGPARNSRYGEEWIIRDFFADKRGGVFVDVGANDYRRDSNTYYLETELGWSGLAIEPQGKFAADYASHRPRTTFLNLFVGDRPDGEATLYVPANDLVASADRAFAEAEGGAGKAVSVKTSRLDDILDGHRLSAVDFLSIDVELHEPQVLAGFSIDRFRPALVCIEAHPEVRQQILDYFQQHRYRLVGKYLRIDTENLWFSPES